MTIKNIEKNKIINFSSNAFSNLFVSPKKRDELKKLINKEKKIVIFRKVVDHNILKNITKNRNVILKGKPHFSNTFLGSKDLYIYNKLNKKSYVKGYFRKIELYPWNKKNKKIYSDLQDVIDFKCYMENLKFKENRKKSFFDKKKFIKIHLNHYPSKKGFVQKHVDGIYKPMSLLLIGMSQNSLRNKNNGLFCYFGNKKINLDKHIYAGDVAIFNPLIPHAVIPTKSGNGRWSLLISSGHFGRSDGTKLQSKHVN